MTTPAQASNTSVNPAAVLGKATLRAAERLGLSRSELSKVIGLSTATLSRISTGKSTLEKGSKGWELAVLLVRLYRGLDAILAGDDQSAQKWMRNANTDLRDTPANLIATVPGLVTTVAYVDANRARI